VNVVLVSPSVIGWPNAPKVLLLAS
jgi:hypothetical protein